MPLHVLSAGAAKAVVNAVAVHVGVDLSGAFGAVGAMQDKFLAGESCDVIVLTRAMLDALAANEHVLGASISDLGRVRTGVAVKEGAARPDVATAQGLRAALLAAEAIYVPDTVKSTAGKHVAAMFETLGIAADLREKLKEFPNGASAMRAMADASGNAAIGCTQVSEILYTEGIALVGPLPAEFELATLYSVAVCSRASDAPAARRFCEHLSGESNRELRREAGFEA